MNLVLDYLGFVLKNPIIASASPLTSSVESVAELERAGVSAVVLRSLFAEQIELAHGPSRGGFGRDSTALGYFPRCDCDVAGPEGYLDLIRAVKKAVRIPVIASLNGAGPGEWIQYAHRMEEAGADAIELNLYHIPTDIHQSGESVEQMYLDTVRAVRESIWIPMSVKIGPYFSSVANMAARLSKVGVQGLTFFNRFYQPDIDLERGELHARNLVLSQSEEIQLPLRWIGLLYNRLPVDFVLTGGVHTHIDALKAVAAGSSAVMIASELIRNGPERVGEILSDMNAWLTTHRYYSLRHLQGTLCQQSVMDPTGAERASYARTIKTADVTHIRRPRTPSVKQLGPADVTMGDAI
jgi:dihydroorotate dehydrogenase (fumarate)